jgi:hypothetical protein
MCVCVRACRVFVYLHCEFSSSPSAGLGRTAQLSLEVIGTRRHEQGSCGSWRIPPREDAPSGERLQRRRDSCSCASVDGGELPCRRASITARCSQLGLLAHAPRRGAGGVCGRIGPPTPWSVQLRLPAAAARSSGWSGGKQTETGSCAARSCATHVACGER